MARLFGLSRTRAAELVAAGQRAAGRPGHRQVRPGQRRRLARGRAAVPPGRAAARRRARSRACASCTTTTTSWWSTSRSGVAAHPSPGWTGPTVVGGLAAAGYRISTSGAAERQGIVHRLDVGTSGLMVVAKSERAYTLLKRAFKERTVDKVYHALVQGHPDPLRGTIDAPDRPPPRSTTTSSP